MKFSLKGMDKKKVLIFLLLPLVLISLGVLTWYVVKSTNLGAKDSKASTSAQNIRIIYEVQGSGRIEGETTQDMKKWGTTSKVKAIPNSGYYFSSWSDGDVNSERSDRAIANKTYRAVFKENLNKISTIKYIAGEGGRVDGKLTQEVEFGGWGESVKAVADDGYEFRGWSSATEYAIRKDKGNGRNVTHKAFFQKIGEEKSRVEYIIEPAGYGEFVDRNIHFPIQYLSLGEEGTPVEIAPYNFTELVIWSDGLKEELVRKDKGRGYAQKKIATLRSKYEKRGSLVQYRFETEGSGNKSLCGYIEGEQIQYILPNKTGKYVVARVLDKRCEFVKWSDGKTNPVRTDLANKEYYREYTAIFSQKNENLMCTQAVVKLKYSVYRPNQGYIEGDRVQELPSGCSNGKTVRAVPYGGYVFSHWYDNEAKKIYPVRNDVVRYTGWGTKNLIAIFKKIEE